MVRLEIFHSFLLEVDVGEVFFTFLFPEDHLGCKAPAHTSQ